jgi:hypothetical protein
VLCLLVVGGVGLYFQWFSISASNTESGTPDIHLKVNKDKFQEDMKIVKEDAKHGAEKIKDEVHGLLGEKKLAGTIQQVEVARQELTVLDNKKQDVTIKVDAATKIKIGDKEGTFDDLKADDPVSGMYEATRDGNVARTITVSRKL